MVYPRELILFADGIWPMCTKVPGVECPEPERECEDCDGPERARAEAQTEAQDDESTEYGAR
ncbi:MAG: hypothetical protein ACYTG3_07905 [Planctomycetota bacterium]|jgi:hypothetical protein